MTSSSLKCLEHNLDELEDLKFLSIARSHSKRLFLSFGKVKVPFSLHEDTEHLVMVVSFIVFKK